MKHEEACYTPKELPELSDVCREKPEDVCGNGGNDGRDIKSDQAGPMAMAH